MPDLRLPDEILSGLRMIGSALLFPRCFLRRENRNIRKRRSRDTSTRSPRKHSDSRGDWHLRCSLASKAGIDSASIKCCPCAFNRLIEWFEPNVSRLSRCVQFDRITRHIHRELCSRHDDGLMGWQVSIPICETFNLVFVELRKNVLHCPKRVFWVPGLIAEGINDRKKQQNSG